jgi:hypothetical protein
MSEKIQAIAKKAKDVVNQNNPSATEDQFLEEFTKQVLKEAASIVDTYLAMKMHPGMLSSLMRKHFGLN